MRTIAKAIVAGMAAALLLSIVSDEADARRRIRPKLGPGIPHGGTRDPNALSRDTLRYCVALENSINARSDGLDEIDSVIERERQYLDRSDRAAVDAFNALVLDQQDHVREINVEVAEFNATCTTKPYYADDLTAARAVSNPSVERWPATSKLPQATPSSGGAVFSGLSPQELARRLMGNGREENGSSARSWRCSDHPQLRPPVCDP
jgi:hypothetical protein